MVQCEETMRKGPWTEQEDVQLVFYVNLFGDRRWDFIAKVSGLRLAGEPINRTGKSCRLRWVNYLHPGLKRGKMTPQEERLVLQLHSKWGNRWSRIARKLPGRTDNEIKNYWRTHMRKKAQERKKAMYQSSSSSSSSSSSESSSSSYSGAGAGSNTSITQTLGSVISTENKDRSFYDTGGFDSDHSAAAAGAAVAGGKKNNRDVEEEEDMKESGGVVKVYSQDEIWNDIELSEDDDVINPVRLYYDDFSIGNSETWPCQTLSGGCGGGGGSCSSPVWDYCPVSLWMTGDDSFYNNQEDLMSLMNSSLVGKDFN